eukprot:597592_1
MELVKSVHCSRIKSVFRNTWMENITIPLGLKLKRMGERRSPEDINTHVPHETDQSYRVQMRHTLEPMTVSPSRIIHLDIDRGTVYLYYFCFYHMFALFLGDTTTQFHSIPPNARFIYQTGPYTTTIRPYHRHNHLHTQTQPYLNGMHRRKCPFTSN